MRNARNTILLHGVQLLLCLLSFISPFINLFLVTNWPNKRTDIFYSTFLFTNVLPRLLSPLIYGLRDKKFRGNIRMHFCFKGCRTVEERMKNFITFFLIFTIICINGAFVYIYFKSKDFQRDPRYVLYIHLVINDMIMLTLSLGLVISTYIAYPGFITCWIMLRYIAVCLPLHHVQICTVQRAHLLIALIWLVSFIPAFTDIIIILITQTLSVFSKKVLCNATLVYNTPYHETLSLVVENFITFFLVFTIICINGAFVYTYFKSKDFQRDPRYVLYIHLVINDMIMLILSLGLVIFIYTGNPGFIPCWIMLRYIAVCLPLHHVQICTVQRAHLLIALIWLVSFIPAFTDIIIILITQPLSVFSKTVICHATFVYNTPYVLYIHLVINDMIMLTLSLGLVISTYIAYPGFITCWIMLRYIAVCLPLHHVQICTVQRAHLLIALIWLVSFIPAFTDIIIILITQTLSVFSKKVLCNATLVYNTPYHETLSLVVENFITFFLIFTIICINGAFVYTYFKSKDFQRDPRYVLYIHLVINDMIMLTLSLGLVISTYIAYPGFIPCWIMLICTVQRAHLLIALIWLVSFIPAFTDIIIILITQPLSVFSKTVICHPTLVYNTPYHETLSLVVENFITFFLIFTIICINGAFVYTYFKSKDFQRDPRYVLYIHLVINDMIMLTLSLGLVISTYTGNPGFIPCWINGRLNHHQQEQPLNLAVMALERYIAVCLPLHHVQICTMQRAHLLIALIWLVSFIPAFTDIIIILITQPLSVFSKPVLCHATFVYNTPYHVTLSLVVELSQRTSSPFLVFTIICINGAFVYTYFKSKDFQRDPRNSPLNLAVMALERYIAVCLPLHHVQICTMQRAHLLIALIWLVSFIPAFTDIIIILITQPLSVFSKPVLCHATFVYNTPYHVTLSLVVE
ncbi:hypothetical protein F7725_016470, partial [Dissostichus mawsoni]